MKRTIIFFALLALSLAGMARPVSQDVARRVAQTWMQAQGMKDPAALQDITAQTPFTEFYVFAAPEGGFVLVSGDDCVKPVLAYSVKNRFVAENMPQHVVGFLMNYEKEIKWIKSHQPDAGQTTGVLRKGPGLQRAEWRALLDGVAPQPSLAVVSPLLTTTWSQSPLYNDLCPSDTSGQAVTGCVATATAQVMKYHNHPAQGYGSHTYTSSREINGISYTYPNLTANFGNTTYQWSQMPNELTSTSTAAQINAVATLMYHIGVADEMRYSPHASGANNYYGGSINSQRASSQESLARYFKYRPDMAVAEREAYSHNRYVAILRGELDQQRPILYSGSDETGGHSFVLDGYDNSGYFHVNWGWAGWLDGYFVIGGLEPGAGGTGANMGSYNMGNGAVLGIRPNTSWSSYASTSIGAYMQNSAPMGASATVSDRTTGSPTSVFSYGDTAVLSVTVPEGYCFSGWTDGDAFNPREVLATGGNYDFTATCEPIGLGDTVGYCRGSIHTLSPYAGGVKLPASALDTTKQLTSVMFHAYQAGTYTITVYTGANHSTTAATATYTVGSSDANAWQTVALGTPVPATDDIWIIIENSDPNAYSVSLTTYSGVPSSFILVWNGSYYEYGANWQRTAMILGIFSSGSTPQPVDCQITTFPYTMNFEATDDIACLTLNDANQDNVTWGLINGYGYNGTTCAYVTYAANADDWLMLPVITTPGTYNVSWKVRAISSNWPETYQVVAMRNGVNATLFSETITDTLYQDRTANFTVAAGDTVKLAWRYISDDQDVLFIDNIVVSEATPQPTQYTITVASNNSAWGTVTGGGTYNSGATATLTATPASGYHFVQWQDANTQNPRTITVTGNATYTATFEADAAPQDNCIITAFPWSEDFDGDLSNLNCWEIYDYNQNDTSWGFTTNYGYNGSNCAYVLYQAQADDWLLTPKIVAAGGYTVSWKVRAINSNWPETYQVWAMGTGDPVMLFSETISDTLYQDRSASFTVTAGDTMRIMWRYISQDKYALFLDNFSISQGAPQPTQYTVTVSSNNSAWGTVTGGGTFNSGAQTVLTATPASGYRFVQWQDGDVQNPRTVIVTSNMSFTAYFEADATPQGGDTVSYCGNSAFATNFGTNGGSLEWGIMLPPSSFNGATYLKSVMIYVAEGQTGAYTLNLYRGGDTVPGTLAHTQTANFSSSQTGWQEVLLDATFALNSQNLWITFATNGQTHPMAVCNYTGALNSDWINLGTGWSHFAGLGYEYSWLIKAVTTSTAPALPAPTVSVDGQYQLAKGLAYTFNAIGTEGASITWSLPGATPSTATGSSATATWNAAGVYNIVATISNAYGVGHDTMQVLVVDYTVGDTVSYALNRQHYTNVGTGNASAFSWGIKMPSALLTGRTHLSGVMAGLNEIGSYTLTIYQGGNDAPQTQIGTYNITTTAADTASGHYFTYTLPSPLAINSASNLWVVIGSTDLEYPAGTVPHTTDTNSDWTLLNGTWYHLPQLRINGSWEMKLIMSAPVPPTQYTITAVSNNNAWGTVTGGGTYNSGATATLTATPTNGYRFVSWQDGNTQNPRTITVTGNATYTATFEAIPPTQYTITAVSNNNAWGTVSGGGTYNAGATATLIATPASGYRFVSWSDGNTQSTHTVTVTGNATYTATFEAIPPTQYTITVVSNNNAWGTVSGGGTYNEGATATLTATPTNGYQFVGWNDGNTDNPRTVTVTGPATYIATFEAMPVQYTITVLSNNDTWGTVSGGGTYNEGATATLTATPANGYHFVSWNDGNTDNPRTITVTASTTYIATFEVAVGIDGVETAAVAIVPNPATEYATLQGLKAGIEVTLVDINGKIRYSGTAQSDMLTLDVSGLTAGVYFVRVSDGTETAVRKLIVK